MKLLGPENLLTMLFSIYLTLHFNRVFFPGPMSNVSTVYGLTVVFVEVANSLRLQFWLVEKLGSVFGWWKSMHLFKNYCIQFPYSVSKQNKQQCSSINNLENTVSAMMNKNQLSIVCIGMIGNNLGHDFRFCPFQSKN